MNDESYPCELCGTMTTNIVSECITYGDRENPPEYEDRVLCPTCQKQEEQRTQAEDEALYVYEQELSTWEALPNEPVSGETSSDYVSDLAYDAARESGRL